MNGQDGMIRDGAKFRAAFTKETLLGKGTEGIVHLWHNEQNQQIVAVKEPCKSDEWHRKALAREIEMLKFVGPHPNIVQLLGWDEKWPPCAPAIMYEVCHLGDVETYTEHIKLAGFHTPEVTAWKLIHDMSKGLHWIHNSLNVPYVHGDLKPGNILVARPSNLMNTSDIPLLPTFKLADISRLEPFLPSGPVKPFHGTPEYGPPHNERRVRQAPPIDIFAIGATLQQLSFSNQWPTQTIKRFMTEMRARNMHVPTETLFHEQYEKVWRFRIPVQYRPLNAPKEQQKKLWDVKYPRPPYSDALNDWYSMLLEMAVHKRITANVLVEWFVPIAEDQMMLLVAKQEKHEAMERVYMLKANAERRRKGLRMQPMPNMLKSQGLSIAWPADLPVRVKGEKKEKVMARSEESF